MKKILLALLLCPVAGFSQILFEDFENGIPSTWTQQITGPGQWEADNMLFDWYEMGSTIAYFNDDFIDTGVPTPWAELRTPIIDLSSYANVQLSFDYFNMVYVDDTTFTVAVYNGSTWVDVLSVTGDAYIENDWDFDLLSAQIDVTPHINDAFQIRFVYDDLGDWSFGAGIDNVLLEGTLSVHTALKNDVVLSPNPTSGTFSLTGLSHSFDVANSTITVTDVSGKILRTFSSADAYDVSDLTSGIYMVTFQNGAKQFVKKLVKN